MNIKKNPNMIPPNETLLPNYLFTNETPESVIPLIDNFLKAEITVAKSCACKKCRFRKDMLRQIQYLVEDYKKIKGL